MKWQAMLEDWLKAFVAGSVAVLITSNYNAESALKAGSAFSTNGPNVVQFRLTEDVDFTTAIFSANIWHRRSCS